MKQKNVTRIVFGCITISFAALVCTAFSFAWFFANQSAENQAINGIVGLREYFYNVYEPGEELRDGHDEDHAFEIVTPTHFYNLTRLQNLGVFSEKKYFKIGHNFGTVENPRIRVLDNNGEEANILDMTSYFSTNDPFLPVGSERAPFYGVFDGQNIPVKGLEIAGNPEDIGVFGYTACDSNVTNFICKDLTVTSLGYSTSGETYFLYHEPIDEIFANEATNFAAASLNYIDGDGLSHLLKKDLVTQSYEISPAYTLNDMDSLKDANEIVAGRFLPDPISTPGHLDFKYSLISSTSVVTVKHDDELDRDYAKIDLSKLPSEFSDPEASVKLDTTISIVASIKIAGFEYSRVVQSYNLEISQSYDQVNHKRVLTGNITCNFIIDEDNVTHLNAKHGNNIGYIVGHADGNVRHCYVYNGKLVLNTDNANLVKIDSQSETGLIGKIGNNVISKISPAGDTTKGETGVLNFSYIYDQIRTPFVYDDQNPTLTYAGKAKVGPGNDDPYQSFVSYAVDTIDGSGKYGPNGTLAASFEKYKDFLQTDRADPKHYITSAGNQSDITTELGNGSEYYIKSSIDNKMNSIAFDWDKVICDSSGENGERGLGVFRIVTKHDDGTNNKSWLSGLEEGTITRLPSGSEITKIYFSTAECDWTKKDSSGKLLPNWSSITPARMNTLPDRMNDENNKTTDTGSFQYPFSRDFDYLFQLDLTEASNYKKADKSIWNYMYNTDSVFLQDYLKSVLINRKGRPVTSGKAFGLKIQFSQDSENVVESLSSYMTIGVPKAQERYSVPVYNEAEDTWSNQDMALPPKSVTFSIDNPNGANVSIIGNGGAISIYSYNPDVENVGSTPTELVSMYSINSANNQNLNMGRFFEHRYEKFVDANISGDVSSNTKTVVKPVQGMHDGSYVYAHIFKLPKGNYVIGASNKKGGANNTARLYYVSVQGQTNGDLGEQDAATIGNYIEDVDFLLKDPTSNGFTLNDSAKANFSFDGIFTANNGAFVVDSHLVTADDPDTQEDETVIQVQAKFNNCVTYLLFYCRKNDPAYILNGTTIDQQLYDGPYSYTPINNVNWEVS